MMICKIIIFVLLVASAIGFIYYLRYSNKLKDTVSHAQAQLNDASAQRQRNEKRDLMLQRISKQGFFGKLTDRQNKRFMYSRLGTVVNMSFELWLALKIAIAAALYIAVITITRRVGAAFIAALMELVLLTGVEQIMAYRNYKIIDDNLSNMVNLMSNFTVTAGDITGVFHKISGYLPDPLQGILEECYYDAQMCGDVSAALYAMIEKVDHPMFAELIRNIEICVHYTANFSVIIASSRKLILEEQRAKKERKAVANDNLVNMFIISLVLVAALFIADNMVDTSIWYIIFQTTVGHVAIGVIAVIYVIFYTSVALAEK